MTTEIKKASCKLEKELFESVLNNTPEGIKSLNLIDLNNRNAFSFILKREHLYKYNKNKNPEGLDLLKWLENYEKEALVSTAGIRGPQNILYPQDVRYPINLIGVTLATLAKALVIKDKGYKNPTKLVAREVRYNSDLYLEAIARLQAAYGIRTLVPVGKQTIPIWLASYLVFKLGLVGGEYITSSHGIAIKNATKDLNSQGSQFLPEESMEFVNKIKEIFAQTEKNGTYEIKFAKADDPLIDDKTLIDLDNGIDLAIEYLKTGIARKQNIDLIKKLKNKIVIDNVGGCAYRTLNRFWEKLEIADKYDWFHIEENPFFHSIGKYDISPTGQKGLYDYSIDANLFIIKENGEKFFPVISSMHYDKKLAKYPINTYVLITDPDNDRLTVTQIESSNNIKKLKELGIDCIKLSKDRVLTIYSANQLFLILMDFRMKELKELGVWNDYSRFIIKTTASTSAWDEWAKYNGIKVINTPVGFKEIANIMKKIEVEICKKDKEVIIKDVFGNTINLGNNPRLLFAGEESGGMILGQPVFLCSNKGYQAIALREKSACCAIILTSMFISTLEKNNETMSKYFCDLLDESNIKSKFDTRADITYYNESEPDIKKLNDDKKDGEKKRTKNDLFFLSLALGVEYKILTLEQVKQILNDAFLKTYTGLDFSDLQAIKFVGDGTYLKFTDKFIEIRPSGTDAKIRVYAAGINKKELEKYAQIMGNFSGKRTDLFKDLIPKQFYKSVKEKAINIYSEFRKNAD
ncbi:MAG: hypothetical protein PHC64_01500 [Candidatus Gastranaerophilales bacterium]|nr:hypothetical protein [Candidatus Gastranaerophilales bacterium]